MLSLRIALIYTGRSDILGAGGARRVCIADRASRAAPILTAASGTLRARSSDVEEGRHGVGQEGFSAHNG